MSKRSSAWAASGAPSDSSGRRPGVYTTAVGYAGGYTPNPTYEEVCSGRTGHAEVVLVVFDTAATSYEELLKLFWEGHDPTQGMRQGNDVGTQYRSAILWRDEAQREQPRLRGRPTSGCSRRPATAQITTEIAEAGPFYYAEDYHQQYLAKNPGGYCGLGGTGVSCPVGLASTGRHPTAWMPPPPADRCGRAPPQTARLQNKPPARSPRHAQSLPARPRSFCLHDRSARARCRLGEPVRRLRPRRSGAADPSRRGERARGDDALARRPCLRRAAHRRLAGAGAACHAGGVRPPEGGHVGGVHLVAVDRVIADLELLVGEAQRHEDPHELEHDERRDPR